MSDIKLTALTLCVLVAFAANSVLGRVALKSSDSPAIDPAMYSAIRIACGAIALTLIQAWRRRQQLRVPKKTNSVSRKQTKSQVGKKAGFRSWAAPLALFLYAVCFSFAYIQLNAAAGTLILFAGVQFTMLTGAAIKGDTIRVLEWLGSLIAFAGLVWLLSPNVSGTSLPIEAVLMLLSGVAWGIYSLIGKGSTDPIADTATNFVLATPLALLLCVPFAFELHGTALGFGLAAASGAITSGLGYVMWYTVLPQLTSPQAASVQLSVPIVAGIGGLVFAGDAVASRTIVAGSMILFGIALTIRWQAAKQRQ